MLPNLGGPEILIVVAILVLLFGAGKIPDLARVVGSGIREFREFREFRNASTHDEERSRPDEAPAELTAAKPEERVQTDGSEEPVREVR